MKVFYLVYCLFLLHFGVLAQRLKGSVFTKEGKPISNATILVKELKSSSDFSEFIIGNETGEFSFELEKKYTNVVFLEFTAFNYSIFIDSIVAPEKNKAYEFQVKLEEKTQILNEIIVTEYKRFEQHGDTTTYSVKAFRDGTERNIEDVLKKIPGVEVNEDDGSLKYLGKRVEAVQLDGDDLFGFRYSSATKNISADMIEKIDAIDHFNSNPLLDGLVESKTTALNLQLKKGKIDLAKNEYIGIGGGNGLALDLAFDLILVSPKSKSYATLSYNNVGMNSSPFNFFSSSGNHTNGLSEEFNAAAPKLIHNKSQNANLSERRSTINDQKNVNLNSIYKFNNLWSVRANVFFLKDKLWNEEFSLQQFSVNQQLLEYKDKITSLKSPLNQQFELKLLYNLGVKRHFEWYCSLGDTEVLNDIDFSKNNQASEKTNLVSRDFLWTQKIDLSQRFRKHFFQLIGQWSTNSTPQSFSPIQSFSFSNASNTFSNLQTSHFSKNNYLYKFNWIRKFSKFRMNYQMAYLSNHLYYRSHLLENQKIVTDFLNDNQYEKSLFTQAAILNYEYKKWTLTVDFSANKMLQDFRENTLNTFIISKKSNYLNFNLDVFNDISNDTKIMLNWKIDHSSVAENYLFLNQVVNQNRGTIQNRVSLDLVENHLLSVGLRKDNLSKGINQSMTLSFMKTKNGIITDLSINENFTKMLYYQTPQSLQFFNCNYSIDKYIYELKSNLNHSSSLGFGNSFNQINASALRENKQFSYVGSLAFRTMRKRIFDIDNKFTYQFFEFRSPDNENINASLNNSFKLILHPFKSYSAWLIWDYYRPNLSDDQSFSFLDCKIERKIHFRQPIKLALLGKNILNQRYFTQLSNNSFSTNMFQSSLLPGYWMITANLEF